MTGLYSEEFSVRRVFSRQLRRTNTEMNSVLFSARISVGDTALGTTIANLGRRDVLFPKALFHGDTVPVPAKVLDLGERKPRPDCGTTVFLHQGLNQKDELIRDCMRAGLVKKKPVTQ